MKKVFSFFILFMLAASLGWGAGRGRGDYAPEVRYISPKDESIVDLKGKNEIVFSWQPTPIPAGDRSAYKFEIYKDFGYDRIANETLSPQTFSISLAAEKFEDGSTYTWQVKQRDRWSHSWSRDKRWSFKVDKTGTLRK